MRLGKCEIWTGRRDKDGYAKQNYWIVENGVRKCKTRSVSRYRWEQKYGKIPNGLLVLHKCDTPSCVRVSHLKLGTHYDNAQDRIKRNRAPRGEQHPEQKLKETDIYEIRALLKTSISIACIAQTYNVSHGMICSIRDKRAWGWLK